MPPAKKALTKQSLRDWCHLEDARVSATIFQHSEYAFDPALNHSYHARNTIHMQFDPSVNDYSPLFENALANLHQQGGGTLQLSCGVYPHSQNVVLPSYTCIRGVGMDVTVLRVTNDAPRFTVAGCVRIRCTRNVSVCDLTIDGNALYSGPEPHYRYGLCTHLAIYTYIRGVAIRNCASYAFDPHGDQGPPVRHGHYLVIEDCVSENNGLDGITVDMTMYVSILRVRCAGNARHGINICTGSAHVLIKGCILAENGQISGKGYALVVQNNNTRGTFGTNSVIFRDNIVRACIRGGVALRDVHNVQIERNTFEHPKSQNHYVVFELHSTRCPLTIQANRLVGNAKRVLEADDACEQVSG